MSYFGTKDFGLEASQGKVSGYRTANQWGHAMDCSKAEITDIWDGADGVTSTKIWIAPTVARIHDIASTSMDDFSAGTGARMVRIFGLTDWSVAEVFEDIILNGETNVPTVNSYIIIHRMNVEKFGSLEENAGTITATAQTDGTVTAAIRPGNGITQMMIMGISSIQTLYIRSIRLDVRDLIGGGITAVKAIFTPRLKIYADQEDSGYIVPGRMQFSSDIPIDRNFTASKIFPGPSLIKFQVETDKNNCIVTGDFEGYIIDN